jgi:hypothetical protein
MLVAECRASGVQIRALHQVSVVEAGQTRSSACSRCRFDHDFFTGSTRVGKITEADRHGTQTVLVFRAAWYFL